MAEIKGLMTLAPSCSHIILYLSNHNWSTLLQAIHKYDHISRRDLSDYQVLCKIIGLIKSLEKSGASLEFVLLALRIKFQDYLDFNDFCGYDAKYIDLIT